MRRLSARMVTHRIHCNLQKRDERELYRRDELDYYALHYRRRLRTVVSIVKRVHAQSVLEIGAAQGNMTLACAEMGRTCIALDINFHHLSYSRMKHENGSAAWVTANADMLPLKRRCFDAIILGELLEHCAWPERILENAAALLADNGIMIITTPNNGFLHGTEPPFSSVKDNRFAIEQHQFGPDGDDHLFTFTAEELTEIVNEAGLVTVRRMFIGSHFMHLPSLYHLRKGFPFLFNTFLEDVVPHIPPLRQRYTSTLLFVVKKEPQR